MNSDKPSSSTPSDAPPGQAGDIGEGSYEATRDYQKNIGDYLKKADVAADARAAAPSDNAEAAELQQAEQEGLSHSKAKGQ